MDKFVIRTTDAQRHQLNIQVSRFVYATNSAFRSVEHPEFLKLIQMLRPGYKPPNRSNVANELLDEVHTSLEHDMKISLNHKTVCLAIDGWSNVHMEPIVSAVVTDVLDDKVHLTNTIDTGEHSHTSEYLVEITGNAIKSNEDKYNCSVGSVVTDNASNMAKMRSELGKLTGFENKNIITYGCSAHYLNLLAHDLQIKTIIENVKQINKYFRNHHFPAAKYKNAGGSALKLPTDVRWNSVADCIESYVDNWHILSKICSENRTAFETNITAKVNNINLKNNAQDYLKTLKLISVALDRVQKNFCVISEATEIWINLLEEFRLNDIENEITCCEKRFNQALTGAHFAANILDPRYCGQKLNNDQIEIGMEFIAGSYSEVMAEVLAFRAKATPFKSYLFSENTLKSTKPIIWWKAFGNSISSDCLMMVNQLFTAVASTASVERNFSSFGLVQSKLRNRLGNEKAAKLVQIFKELN